MRLKADLPNKGALSPPIKARYLHEGPTCWHTRLWRCIPGGPVAWVHMALPHASDLRGMQANYQHTDFPQHKDDADGDGFGRDVATLNVRGDGRAVICERLDFQGGREGAGGGRIVG